MKKIVLLLVVGIFLSACAKKEVKQVSAESATAQEAFGVAESVKTAFVTKDVSALKRLTTEEGLKDVIGKVGSYESVEITFTPRWMEIEPAKTHVYIAWKSAWKISGKTVDDRGMAVFVMEGRPMKVAKILRANPFQTP